MTQSASSASSANARSTRPTSAGHVPVLDAKRAPVLALVDGDCGAARHRSLLLPATRARLGERAPPPPRIALRGVADRPQPPSSQRLPSARHGPPSALPQQRRAPLPRTARRGAAGRLGAHIGHSAGSPTRRPPPRRETGGSVWTHGPAGRAIVANERSFVVHRSMDPSLGPRGAKGKVMPALSAGASSTAPRAAPPATRRGPASRIGRNAPAADTASGLPGPLAAPRSAGH